MVYTSIKFSFAKTTVLAQRHIAHEEWHTTDPAWGNAIRVDDSGLAKH
jgi:hypothetical protein